MNNPTVPVIVDLGRKKKRVLRALERGRGRLMDEIDQTIHEVRDGLGKEAEAEATVLVPIVLIYKRKRKRKRRRGGWF